MDNNRTQLGILKYLVAVNVAFSVLATISTMAYASGAAFTWAKRYNLNGQLTATISADPDGGGALRYIAQRIQYNAQGMQERVESGYLDQWPSHTVKPRNWEAEGFSFQVHDATYFTYDNWGRPLSEQKVDSQGVAYSLTQFSYDSLGRLRCRVVRMSSTELSSLSACSVASGGDGEDRVTRYTYDNKDRVTLIEKAYGTSLRQSYAKYTYNLFWQQSSVKDANGNYTELQYDGFGRLKKMLFPSKTQPGTSSASDYEWYDYDNNGNLTVLRKRSGQTIRYQYDSLDRVTVKNIPNGTANDVYYRYNLQGLELSARYGSSTGYGVTASYNGFGEIMSETTSSTNGSYTVRYQYDLNGNITRLTYPDNRYFSYEHDGLDRLIKLKNQSGNVLSSYTYDNYGQLESLSSRGSVTAFGYDPIARLNAIQYQVEGQLHDLSIDFEFNSANQIVQKTISNNLYAHKAGSGQPGNYQVNGLNQYESFAGTDFTYDDNGNMTSTGSLDFTYDVENRLISASGGSNVAFSYDPKGRLQVESPNSGLSTVFVYAGDALIAEYQNGQMIHRYVHNLKGREAPLIAYTGSAIGRANRHHLQVNHQGSVIAATNADGAVDYINTYDVYGIPGADNQGRFTYTGQTFLPSLGMYYYKARIYSPELGRFLQTDPIGYEDQMNLYAYVGNDPMNMTDPTGMYGKGNGWSDKDWKKFDAAQKEAAANMTTAAGDLKSEAGQLGEGEVSGDGYSASELNSMADTLDAGAKALNDDGSGGYFAHSGNSSDTDGYFAAAEVGGTSMTVDVGNASFQDHSSVRWMAGHESLHNAGLEDQKRVGYTAYRFGNFGQKRAFKKLSKSLRHKNPDHVMSEVYP
ncbi:RHS repeat domain-containing protein [Gilvimarinus agarilyticus]|uniref:RHS repeat domain-containing protein n=1 Tax=Gilvimarinus agarilyticus TaxID=679259 RepID=UPI00069807DD|nr:RHS repeat-associated core domain-containing protein [Gilvimarinus agarilyticus]